MIYLENISFIKSLSMQILNCPLLIIDIIPILSNIHLYDIKILFYIIGNYIYSTYVFI